MDLCDLYRGKLSHRRLIVLIRNLPRDSALVTAMNEGQPVWSPAEHLLADLWTLQVRVNSEKGSLADDFDHPVRASISARAKAESKKALKELYLKRKRQQLQGGE